MVSHLNIETKSINSFCKKWKVVELSLFGSVLSDQFGESSDIDVLISFSRDAKWDLFDLVDMREELKQIFGRDVDLVEKGTIRNPFRKKEILSTREILYAA